ncbi:hypothetical protein L2D14_01470 [Thalassospiraceae bacterium LMO-JJ14]|nr:hypothetical protein L2D14_01470 [Thalassospiraceae bacterium LMO-JJ14]
MSDQIQIGDVAPRVRYTADGTISHYSYPFAIFSERDLEVFVGGVMQTLNADYTVAGAGERAGGVVDFVSPPPANAAVTLVRRLSIRRTSDFVTSGDFKAGIINGELDFLSAGLQQVNDDLVRSLRLSKTDTQAALTLPDTASRSGRAVVFDADGNAGISSFIDTVTGLSVSTALPLADSGSGAAGSSGQVSAADHAHPLPELTDFGIASEADAVAGTDDTKAMTPLRAGQAFAALGVPLDQTARDLAASALAYVMASNDAAGITGNVGPFLLADDFAIDSLGVATGALYDANGDYYHNPPFVTFASADYAGAVGSFTLTPDGSVMPTTYNLGIYRTAVVSGDFDLSFTWTTVGSTSGTTGLKVACLLASAIGSFNSTVGVDFGLSGANIPFGIMHASNTFYLMGDNSSEATISVAGGDAFRINREGSTFKVYKNDVLLRTMTAASSADVYIAVGVNAPGSYDRIDNFGFDLGAPANMTLAPSAVTLDTANPSDVMAYVVLEPQESITPGTDLTMEISIDGGVTFTMGTWTKVGNLGAVGKELYRIETDVSSQAGASLSYRLKSANNKQVRCHDCVGLIAMY